MDQITRKDIPVEVMPGWINPTNWRVWLTLESIARLVKRVAICRICGHEAWEHFDFFSSSTHCRECDKISDHVFGLPEYAVSSFWVGFLPCREFAPYDPIAHSSLCLPGYALTVEEQRERQARPRPMSEW